MKNIYLKEANKSSVLGYIFETGHYHIFTDDDKDIANDLAHNRNVYITDNSEIKFKDWYISNDSDIVMQYLQVPPIKGDKKIILTDNIDLITDGVQEIPEDFYPWFVENEGCEYVDVMDWYNNLLSCCKSKEDCYCNKKRITIPQEKPKCTCKEHDPYCCKVHGSCPNCCKKEEPKHYDDVLEWGQINNEQKETIEKAFRAGKTIQSNNSGKWTDFVCQNQLDSPNWEYKSIDNWRIKPEDESSPGYNKQTALLDELADELKKETIEEYKIQQFKYDNLQDAKDISSRIKVVETLEEAAERFSENHSIYDSAKDDTEYGFINGAKWQAEKDKKLYSEKEVKEILFYRETEYLKTKSVLHIDEWFEWYKQNKKK